MPIKEKIERALGRYLMPCLDPVAEAITGRRKHHLDIDALAESEDVIMIEAEVEHRRRRPPLRTAILLDNGRMGMTLSGGEHIGIPGPYLFIGLPLDKKPEER